MCTLNIYTLLQTTFGPVLGSLNITAHISSSTTKEHSSYILPNISTSKSRWAGKKQTVPNTSQWLKTPLHKTLYPPLKLHPVFQTTSSLPLSQQKLTPPPPHLSTSPTRNGGLETDGPQKKQAPPHLSTSPTRNGGLETDGS